MREKQKSGGRQRHSLLVVNGKVRWCAGELLLFAINIENDKSLVVMNETKRHCVMSMATIRANELVQLALGNICVNKTMFPWAPTTMLIHFQSLLYCCYYYQFSWLQLPYSPSRLSRAIHISHSTHSPLNRRHSLPAILHTWSRKRKNTHTHRAYKLVDNEGVYQQKVLCVVE